MTQAWSLGFVSRISSSRSPCLGVTSHQNSFFSFPTAKLFVTFIDYTFTPMTKNVLFMLGGACNSSVFSLVNCVYMCFVVPCKDDKWLASHSSEATYVRSSAKSWDWKCLEQLKDLRTPESDLASAVPLSYIPDPLLILCQFNYSPKGWRKILFLPSTGNSVECNLVFVYPSVWGWHGAKVHSHCPT